MGILSEMYRAIEGTAQREAIRRANSMEVFADGEPTFNFGAWREWRQACIEAGRTIPPAEFKAARAARGA